MNSAFVPESSLEAHLDQVQARWDALRVSNDLQARSERVQAEMDPDAFDRMMTAASRAKSSGQRVLWLHRAADVVAGAVSRAKASACKKGCDHCCHIPVSLSRSEATHLAAVSEKRMATAPVGAVRVASELEQLRSGETPYGVDPQRWSHHVGQPCPFLRDGECTVWDARPLACRYYYTMDADNLLCRLISDKTGVEVPQFNMLAFIAMSWSVLGLNQEAADIRDWFPSDA